MNRAVNLKKGIAFVIAMIMICIAFAGVVAWNTSGDRAFAAGEETVITLQINNPSMTVNGESAEIDSGRGTVPVIESDRTLLPVRSVIEAVGGTVE